jgi:hypothetical protein
MFAIKIALSVATDETREIKHNTEAMFSIKIIMPSTTDETTEMKQDTLTMSATKQYCLYQM